MNYCIYVKEDSAWISSSTKKGRKYTYNNLVFNEKTKLYKDLEKKIQIGIAKVSGQYGLVIDDYFYKLEKKRVDDMIVFNMTSERLYVGFVEFNYVTASEVANKELDFMNKVLNISTKQELIELQNEIKTFLGANK